VHAVEPVRGIQSRGGVNGPKTKGYAEQSWVEENSSATLPVKKPRTNALPEDPYLYIGDECESRRYKTLIGKADHFLKGDLVVGESLLPFR